MSAFKSGFVNIIGFPNAGKSTLINQFIGEKIAIVTPKVQTTRQRLLGFLNTDQYQIIFSDTPGILEPAYELQKMMVADINEAFEDADIILYIIEIEDTIEKHKSYIDRILSLDIPFYLLINKIDLSKQEMLDTKIKEWQSLIPKSKIVPLSALHNFNVQSLLEEIIKTLPEHEAYFDEDMLTDKSERFLASETIREKIFMHYQQEIPYACEVAILSFKDEESILRISAEIYVERKSQKPILIGKGGEALKEIGTEARLDMEQFFGKKVFLELHVKVRENWKSNPLFLKRMGYKTKE